MRFTTQFLVFLMICILCVIACDQKPQQKQQETAQPQTLPEKIEKVEPLGKIVFLKGDVLVDSIAAELNMPIQAGSLIQTGDTSMVDIVFQDKNIIRIYENSETKLNLEKEEKNVILNAGTIANVIQNLKNLATDKQETYEVRTPTGVAAIRGTSFFIKIEDRDNTYICCCNGVVQVKDSTGTSEQIIEASHHKGIRFSRHNDKIALEEAAMLYHTDEDIEVIAEKINVQIDWTTIDKK